MIGFEARVVKLVDTLDLGSSASGVGVRVPPFALFFNAINFPASIWNGNFELKLENIVKYELTDKDQLLKELLIEVEPEVVTGKTDEKLNELRKHKEIKGYRKGKAPKEVIEQLYGDAVKGEVAEEVIKETYTKAVREKELKVASYPNITEFNFTDDGGVVYKAEVEVFPEIGEIVYDGLELPKKEIEVQDKEIDDVVEMMRKRKAEVRDVSREARETDIVTLDIVKLEDPKNVIPTDKFDGQQVDLSNQMTVKEFKEALPGMKVDEEKEVEVQYADDYPDKTFAGAYLKYKVKVTNIKEQILPELNDGFAKSTGESETMLELRMKIREHLTLQKEEEFEKDNKTKVITHLCEKNQVPIPKALVEDYLKNVTEDFKKNYKDQQIDEEEIRKNYEPIGINTIRWNMLFHELAEKEKIEVKAEDTDKLINKFAENYKITPEQARESIQKSGNIADLRETILEDKVVEFIMSKAKIV